MSLSLSSPEVTRWVDLATEMLPGNATKFEQALLAAELHHGLPVPIADLWNPAACPEHLLPYLGWALSVDIWDEKWPLTKRREVVAKSIELHRLKGTLEGIRRHAALVDGEVVSAITPPARSFLSAGLTLEERREYMRALPEIRIYTLDGRGDGTLCRFSGELNGGVGSFDEGEDGEIASFPIESEAWKLFGRRAKLVDRGVTTDLIIQPVTTADGQPIPGAERYLVPGDGTGGSFYDGGPFDQGFFGETKAPARVITVTLMAAGIEGLDGLTAAREGLTPVSVVPERVAVTSIAHDGVFIDTIMDGWHFVGELPEAYVYDSLRLHDPSRDVIGTVAYSFMNYERFGIDAHTAEIKVSVRDVRAMDAVGAYVGGFFVETGPDKLNRVLDAIQAASAAHETILINTNVDRAPTLGGEVFLGAGAKLGQPVRG